MGCGDGSNDGQAKAVAVLVMGAVRIETLEWLEEPVDLGGRDDRSGVGDGEHGVSVFGDRGGDLDLSAESCCGRWRCRSGWR